MEKNGVGNAMPGGQEGGEAPELRTASVRFGPCGFGAGKKFAVGGKDEA